MSIDFKIQNLCDHMVNWEVGLLQPDLKSVLFSKPIASGASLTFRINNVVIDPVRYTVRMRNEVISANRPFYIETTYKVRDFDPLCEAQYTTLKTFCRKCAGTNYVDDFVYINDSDIRTCKDEELLLQLVEKYIVTKIGSNAFHEWIGTGLHTLVGTKIVDADLLKTRMTEQVTGSIDKLKNVQKQMLATGREMSPGELFGQLLSIQVTQADDPSVFRIIVRFTSQRGVPLQYEQSVDLTSTRQRIAFT